MADVREFDVVVIGAGPAGEVCAGRIADRGEDVSVAIVEEHLVGGECSFYGCMPSKALLRPYQVVAEAHRVPGVTIAGRVDSRQVLARRDQVISKLDDASQVPWLTSRGIELVRGRGALGAADREVVVTREGHDDIVLRARTAVVIATGTVAVVPPIPGLRESNPWTNHQGTTAYLVPHELLVIGGGVIGVELGQAWASLGSRVTIVEAADRLIAREEEFASEELAAAMKARAIDVLLGQKVASVRRDGDKGKFTATLESGRELVADELLVAIGRRPLTADMGLARLGLEDGRYIEVDEHLRVPGHEWLYVVGDCNGKALLTHMGKYQARVAGDHILGDADARDEADYVAPRVTFTEPQVAAVGHTLASALEAGIEARAIDVSTSGTAGASFHGRGTPGTSRLVVDDTDVIVGATFVGVEVAEWLQAATIAVASKLSLAQLQHAIAPFPTRSEVWLKLIEEAGY